MGFGGILKGLGAIGSAVAAPFTAGTSLSFLPALLGGASAVGGILENTKGARTSTTTPTFAPEYKTLQDLLRTRAEERLRSNLDMSGYAANGISNINDAFGGIKQALDNNLTTRGLASSPVAGIVDQNAQLARAGNITEFLNLIPQLQRQFQNQDFGIAQDVLNAGRGTQTVNPGSAVAGGFSSAAEMLAYLAGKGILGGRGGGGDMSQGAGY